MRKSGAYITSVYMGYSRKYYRRKEYKRKEYKRNWLYRIGKRVAILSLAAAVGVMAADKIATGVGQLQSAMTGKQSITTSVSMTSLEELSGTRRLLSDIAAEEEEKELVYSDYLAGYVGKERQDTLIVLDPGHGGEDEGCAQSGVEEKTINLEIALAVQNKLEELGYQVLLTRDVDQALTLEERVEFANKANADIYVSIHQNSSESSKVEGIEVWYNRQNKGDESERLSKLIQKYAVQDTGAVNREILEEENLYVIRECAMPACLVETGFLSNVKERGKLATSEYQEQMAEGIVSGIDLFFHPKSMYLTFDDGPSEANTNTVLDILKERNIKATFFVVGENVKKYPEVAKRIVEEGHTIGIHCNWHDYDMLYESVDSYLADFEEALETVKEVTGVETKLFRFPGGSINTHNKNVYEKIAEEMTARGYIYFDWNASLEDAVKDAKQETLIQNAVSSTLGRKHVVMLAHDVVDETALCLDELLDQFPEYWIQPLTEDVTPVQF